MSNAANDPRLSIGAFVEALAHHVSNLAECSRRYGSQAKSKIVPGIVVESRQERISSATNAGRMRTLIVADYLLGGSTIKRSVLNIRSVKSVERGEGHSELENLRRLASEESQPLSRALENDFIAPTAVQPVVRTQQQPTDEEEDNRIEDAPADNGVPTPAAGARLGQERPIRVHNTDWVHDHEATQHALNGNVQQRLWSVRSSVGNVYTQSCDVGGNQWSPLDYFLIMFPMTHMQEIVRMTNERLVEMSKCTTTVGEVLKFFGVMILSTKFEFKSRASLWSTTPSSKYIAAPSFGTTGMSRMRFDDLWRFIRWSRQPPERPEGMTSEQYRWRLVDDFVVAFNYHRAATFQPSEMICVDESISRWYGKGGHWINRGLPMYVAMERKPDNGCEIQNSACGTSGIMMRLKLVKTADENRNATEVNHDPQGQELPHAAAILKELILPWAHTNRIVCADSYFASVPAAKLLSRYGTRFIGVVKTATRNYPMSYLQSVELNQRGDRKGLISFGVLPGDPTMLAFVWMDRQRRYFIATASSLEAGTPYTRWRWRQVDPIDTNADPTNVQLLVPQPRATELYYSACGIIDRHNRARQDTLRLEAKLETHDWSWRVNMTILGIIVVDTWLVYSQCTETKMCQKDFYTR